MRLAAPRRVSSLLCQMPASVSALAARAQVIGDRRRQELKRGDWLLHIREYETHDLPAIRACVVALQDFERELDPRMPPGSEIADAYVQRMLERCRDWSGTIFVATTSVGIEGFVCVWSRVPSDEPDDGLREYGLISDLIVLAPARGSGIGRALLARAEAYARHAEVRWLRLGVLSGNSVARSLYSGSGYRPYLEYFEKELTRPRSAPSQ